MMSRSLARKSLCRALKHTLVMSVATASFAALPLASANPDYERGYREGYRQGYQDGQKLSLSAESVSIRSNAGNKRRYGIVVIRARYGNNEHRCELTAWAAERFNGRTSAEVDVTNQLCGDPAPTKRKELTVEYYCNGEARTSSAYEHRRLNLSCY